MLLLRRRSPRRGAHSLPALALLVVGCVGEIGDAPAGPGPTVDTSQSLCALEGPNPPPNAAPSPVRRLTREEYNNSVRDLFDAEPSGELPSDERLDIYYTNSTALLGDLDVARYAQAAESVAEAATWQPCDDTTADEAACSRQILERLGRRVFRRPLTPAEVDVYVYGPLSVGMQDGDLESGVRLVIEAMLQSPHFLYHVELTPQAAGGDAVQLSPYEVASRLSYSLWASTPDDPLLAAADDGRLSDVEGLRAEAERLLADPRAERGLSSFVLQWLGLTEFELLEKDDALFTPELRQAMVQETASFASYVVLRDNSRLETLLTAPYTLPEGPMFDFYGVTPGDDPSEPTQLDPSQRAGLLTQPSVLASHAQANQSSPVRRGKMIREALMCQPLPAPPPNIPPLPPPDPDLTTREILEEHRKNEACAGCHAQIDPPGLAFEHYDELGRYRDTENGKPIDSTGELTDSDVAGPFEDGLELAGMLAESDEVGACVVRQYFRFALGRIEGHQDACSLVDSEEAFFGTQKNVKELLIAVITSDAFRYGRRTE